MSTPFARTERALRADRPATTLLRMALLFVLLAAWSAWFLASPVTSYVAAESARLEVDAAAHALESVAGGAVVASRLAVGRAVAAGEVLVELDGTVPRLELARERTHVAGLTAELAALDAVAAAEGEVTTRAAAAASAALAEAQARFRAADGAARFAEDEERRTAKLRADGTVSELEMARASSQATQLRAGADALQEGAARIDRSEAQHAGEREARRRELARERVSLAGALATATATVELLERRSADCSVRAPVAGVLGDVRELGVGTVVVAGEQLGAIIPAGELRVVARFAPGAALGRLKPGQSAELHLDAFPWAQYGSVAATVRSVASEVRDGTIRVELALAAATLGTVRLEHGLTGAVEVAVERLTPAQLVLRFLGQWVRGASDRAHS